MKRNEILGHATRLICRDRQETHGNAWVTHYRIGVVWGVVLGQAPVPPAIVALMMAALKVVRASQNLTHEDNYVDLAGYAALAGELAIRAADRLGEGDTK